MIRMRHQQPNLWETFFGEEVADLWEPWMRAVDELLEDDAMLDAVYQAQGRRHDHSRTRGRHQTPAEVVLRMLILKLCIAIIPSARNRLTRHGMETNIGRHASLFPLGLSIRPTADERSPSHRDRECCLATATRGIPAKT